MMHKIFFCIFLIFFCIIPRISKAEEKPEADQQIQDFSISGFGEKGKKAWDISGRSADIFDTNVKLKDVTGNMYGEKEQVKLKADEGNFDRAESKVFLEKNVQINTSSGTQMNTDTLQWDRKKQLVTTDDKVNITRENMITTAIGAVGAPNLNKVTLGKDVKVDILPVEQNQDKKKNKIIITCDGPLEVDYAKNIATFKNNVKVDTGEDQIYSDTMDIYFGGTEKEKNKPQENKNAGMMDSRIEKIVARGHVKIARGENVSYSDEAVYTALDRKIVLTGRPQLIISSEGGA